MPDQWQAMTGRSDTFTTHSPITTTSSYIMITSNTIKHHMSNSESWVSSVHVTRWYSSRDITLTFKTCDTCTQSSLANCLQLCFTFSQHLSVGDDRRSFWNQYMQGWLITGSWIAWIMIFSRLNPVFCPFFPYFSHLLRSLRKLWRYCTYPSH